MPSTAITIKPANHRVYKCNNDKKIELIEKIISENSTFKAIVVCSNNTDIIKDSLKDVIVMSDKEFITNKELTCELLISYDVPQEAIIYMARVAKATNRAIVLVDESEQKKLYPIETLLGRVIKQDVIVGFEYPTKAPSQKPIDRTMSKDKIKEVAKKRYKNSTSEPKPKRDYSDKPKKDFKKSDTPNKWDKKDKPKNKYLGKDENGKAIFSGKSGDRNHRYDGTQRDKYDAPKVTGKKININSIKKPKVD